MTTSSDLPEWPCRVTTLVAQAGPCHALQRPLQLREQQPLPVSELVYSLCEEVLEGPSSHMPPPPVPPDKLCCLHGPRMGQASGSRCRLWQGRGTEVLGSPAHTPAPKQQSPDLPPSGLTLLVKDHWLCRPQRQSGPSQKCTLMPGEGGLGKPGGQVLFLQFLQIMFL